MPFTSARPTRSSRSRRVFALAVLGTSLALTALGASFAVLAQSPPPKVRLSTSAGDIVIALDAAKAPKTVANFLQYVRAGHYDGTVFHRVIPTFMIQGGGMTADMKEKPTRAPIPLESRNGLPNVRGAVAMARTGDPDSATSQFFIDVQDNPRLDAPNAADGNGYAVFGSVVAGMDVVDKIRAVPTGSRGPHDDVPTTPVTIKKATLEK